MSPARGIRGLARIFAVALTGALPAQAERLTCDLRAPCPSKGPCVVEAVTVSFEIDHTQFVAPVDRREPPRNKVTRVSLRNATGDREFRAEPIVMADGTRGFWAEIDGIEHLMTIRPDGRGSYVTSGAAAQLTGRCRRS